MKKKVSVSIDDTNFLNLNELADEQKQQFYELFEEEIKKIKINININK